MQGTVLIVEDNLGIRVAMQEVLGDAGYTVVTASGGREALAVLQKLVPPCVVLVDLMMPDVSGWDLIQEMRADHATAQIPIVIVSAVGAAIAPIAGVVEILQKPVDATRLLSAVVRHCHA